mgnify:CR=1 FL=1
MLFHTSCPERKNGRFVCEPSVLCSTWRKRQERRETTVPQMIFFCFFSSKKKRRRPSEGAALPAQADRFFFLKEKKGRIYAFGHGDSFSPETRNASDASRASGVSERESE